MAMGSWTTWTLQRTLNGQTRWLTMIRIWMSALMNTSHRFCSLRGIVKKYVGEILPIWIHWGWVGTLEVLWSKACTCERSSRGPLWINNYVLCGRSLMMVEGLAARPKLQATCQQPELAWTTCNCHHYIHNTTYACTKLCTLMDQWVVSGSHAGGVGIWIWRAQVGGGVWGTTWGDVLFRNADGVET